MPKATLSPALGSPHQGRPLGTWPVPIPARSVVWSQHLLPFPASPQPSALGPGAPRILSLVPGPTPSFEGRPPPCRVTWARARARPSSSLHACPKASVAQSGRGPLGQTSHLITPCTSAVPPQGLCTSRLPPHASSRTQRREVALASLGSGLAFRLSTSWLGQLPGSSISSGLKRAWTQFVPGCWEN